MHDGKLPGCFVSDELLAKVQSERVDDHIERAAQQVAMYKAMGAAGVDIGGVPNFEMFSRILTRADEIGSNWEQFKDNLCWPAKDPFYLYDEIGRQGQADHALCDLPQAILRLLRTGPCWTRTRRLQRLQEDPIDRRRRRGEGAIFKLFNSSEKGFEYLAFDCEECGDCFLPENFGFCTMGGSRRAWTTPPAATPPRTATAATTSSVCAPASGSTRPRLRKTRTVDRGQRKATPANHDQQASQPGSTAHLVHHQLPVRERPYDENALISIGESIHASIPKTGQIMEDLHALGKAAYTTPSPQPDYVRALIESQANDGADYIAVNLDAFGEQDPQQAVDIMVESSGSCESGARRASASTAVATRS